MFPIFLRVSGVPILIRGPFLSVPHLRLEQLYTDQQNVPIYGNSSTGSRARLAAYESIFSLELACMLARVCRKFRLHEAVSTLTLGWKDRETARQFFLY